MANPAVASRSRAAAAYGSSALATRIAGASPHELVTILYEELISAIDTMRSAAAAGQERLRSQGQSRALAVLHGLESGLDFDRGGELAGGLAALYRQIRKAVLASSAPDSAEQLDIMRGLLADVALAWTQIARPH
jgi:flagellar secretion chaperone FliS